MDKSYGAKNYFTQGSTELVIGGVLKIQGGSTLETTAAALSNYGFSRIASTKIKHNFKIGAPPSTYGGLKIVTFDVSNATGYLHLGCTAAPFYINTTGNKYLKMVAGGSVILIGEKATKWRVISHTTGVTGTTSST